MKKAIIFTLVLFIVINIVNSTTISQPQNLWWFNDTVTNTNTAVDYGYANQKMNNKSATSNIIASGCAGNYTNCGYGDTGRWEIDTGNSIPSGSNYTTFFFANLTVDESTGDIFYGDTNSIIKFIDAGTNAMYVQLKALNASNYFSPIIYGYLDKWQVNWLTHFYNDTENVWQTCTGINDFSVMNCSVNLNNGSWTATTDWTFGNSQSTGYFQAGAIWINNTMNKTDYACVYSKLLAGNKTFICEETYTAPIPDSCTQLSAVQNLKQTNVSNSTLTMGWSALTGASKYFIRLNGTNIINITGTTTFQNYSLLNGTYYNWTVAGVNESCTSDVVGIESTNLLNKTLDNTWVVSGIVFSEDSILINMSGDNLSNVIQDTTYLQNWSISGTVGYLNKTYCKWYGCLNLSASSGDYISAMTNWTFNGTALSFWVYPLTTADITGITQGVFIRDAADTAYEISAGDGTLGMDIRASSKDGKAYALAGDGNEFIVDTWQHYFLQYNGNRIEVWRDGAILLNSSEPFGSINTTQDLTAKIGIGRNSGNGQIYLDEFVMYNRSNFTQSEVTSVYDSRRFGTPPDKDIYVSAIRYNLTKQRDWASANNTLIKTGTMPINFTIGNAGLNATDSFNYVLRINDKEICNGSLTLSAQSTADRGCEWSIDVGIWNGTFIVDVNNSIMEDIEINNIYSVWIPYKDRPYAMFNLTEWDSILSPYCFNASNAVAYDSCLWTNNFAASDFNQAYTGDQVDPYASNARKAAMSCMANNYNFSKTTNCARAIDHLHGWANRSISTYTSVQAYHQLMQVGIAYDIMYPVLNEWEQVQLSSQYYQICQHISAAVRPDEDVSYLISGDNGKGFGAGIGFFCDLIIGEYPYNPTLLYNDTNNYYSKSLADAWMTREESYLYSYKNDSWSQYQEGLSYKAYSEPHIAESLWFRYKNGLIDTTKFNNAVCAKAREFMYLWLDTNYKGSTFRGDGAYYFRAIQRGDSHSYQKIDDSLFPQWDLSLYWASMCDDPYVKSETLWLRNYIYERGESEATNTYPADYLWKQVEDNSYGNKTPDKIMPRFIYDNANDIVVVRTNYTYVNDTVFYIDGGEERGGGHSQAQGYYLYILGEPFIDYEQVPYEDDVRMDVWKNGISFRNTTQTAEGTGGLWNSVLGQYGYNQYYGGSESKYYNIDYPDYRAYPLQYGGDIENYFGTQEGKLAGAFVWRPYYNATQPVREYFIKFGDTVAKRTTVSGVSSGDRIYHNFLNVDDEFTSTISGMNWTSNRTNNATKQNIYLDTQLVYSDSPIYLSGTATTVHINFAKTADSGATKVYGRRYYSTDIGDTALDLIFSHHWNVGSSEGITAINSTEKGLQDGNNYIYFDGDNSGNIYTASAQTDGWGLAYNTVEKEYACFNCTQLNSSLYTMVNTSARSRYHIKQDTANSKYYLTIDTYDKLNYIDGDVPVDITVNVQDMAISTTVDVTKDGVSVASSKSGNDVTFTASTSQNGDVYLLEGSGVDVTAPSIASISNTTTNTTAYIIVTSLENFNLSVAYGNSAANLTEGTITNTTKQNPNTISINGLAVNKTYYYNTTLCDSSGNCDTYGIYYFTTQENEGADVTAPGIISFTESGKTDAAFTITMLLNESGNATFTYSIYENLSDATETVHTTYAASHAFTQTSLDNNTMYFWMVNGSDVYGNYYVSALHNTTTLQSSTPTTFSILSTCSDITNQGIQAAMALVNLLQVVATLVAVKYIIDIVKDMMTDNFSFDQSEPARQLINYGFTIIILSAIGLVLQYMC